MIEPEKLTFVKNKGVTSFLSRPIVVAIAVNLVLFSLFFLTFSPLFESNDDLTMMEIASGFRYDDPSEYLVFINVILGLIFKALYTAIPSFNWYIVVFYLIHFVSLSVTLSIFLKQNRAFFGAIVYLILFAFFEISFLANLQFTTTAMVAGCAGILSILDGGERLKETDWATLIGGGLLIIISGWMRIRIFQLLMVLFLPLIFLRAIQTRQVKTLLTVIFAGFIVLGTTLFHNAYYDRDPGWKHYRVYNSLRTQITDYPYARYTDKTAPIYAAAGWSENDVSLYKNWIFLDQDVYALEDLQYLTQRIRPELQDFEDILDTLRKTIEEATLGRLSLSFFIATGSLLLVHWHSKLTVSSVIGMTLAALGYLIYTARLPLRVLYSILYAVNLILCFLLLKGSSSLAAVENRIAPHLWLKITGFLMVALLLLPSVFLELEDNIERIKAEEQAHINAVTEELGTYDYLYGTATGPLKNLNLQLSLFPETQTNFESFYIGGWFVPSPIHNREIESYGVEANFSALIRDDLLIVAHRYHLSKLVISLKENYQIDADFAPVIEIGDYVAYSLFETTSTGQ